MFFVGSKVVKNIIDPSTFIKELLNGDVVISYISRDIADFGTIYINTYEHNFFNNNCRLKNSIPILEKIYLVEYLTLEKKIKVPLLIKSEYLIENEKNTEKLKVLSRDKKLKDIN